MNRLFRWLEALTDWMERDTARMVAQQDEDWKRTDAGRAGVPRESVSWWRRKVAILAAARQGRFKD